MNMNDTCEESSERLNLALNVAIHVFILFCILSIFFMFYVSNLSRQALNNELDTNIKNMIDAKVAVLSEEQRYAIRRELQHLPLNKIISIYENPSAPVTINNKMLFRIITIINVAMFLMILLSIFLIKKVAGICPPIRHILFENFVVFSLVGIIEVIFFKFVASQFIPVKPSVLVNSTISSLQSKF